MKKKLLDINLGVSTQAIAIAKKLARIDFTKIEGYENAGHVSVQTSAFYNGRERGVALTFQAFRGDALPRLVDYVITFGEHRNSDSIFIDAWPIDEVDINPVTVNQFTDEAYANRHFVDYEEYDQAVEYILGLVRDWFAGKVQKEQPNQITKPEYVDLATAVLSS